MSKIFNQSFLYTTSSISTAQILNKFQVLKWFLNKINVYCHMHLSADFNPTEMLSYLDILPWTLDTLGHLTPLDMYPP